jgi:phosphoribosylformimino-5-aminoimidazole carboxamide ribotide isomerase
VKDMQLIPAIDLIKGSVVRLSQGDPKTLKKYDYLGDPVTIAKKWEIEGAEYLHIIDLDAALSMGDNLPIITKIVKSIKIPIQVGGGIRKIEKAEKLFSAGVNRIILGSLVFTEPEIFQEIRKKIGEQNIVIALDHKDGEIMIEGWKKSAGTSLESAINRFTKRKINNFLVTAISKDGTLKGTDLNKLQKICRKSIKIIAAGGIGSLDDLILMKKIGVEAVVIGKALYEGVFTLKEAIEAIRSY